MPLEGPVSALPVCPEPPTMQSDDFCESASRMAQALRNARIGFFDYRADRDETHADNLGSWRWSGADFGILGIGNRDGRASLFGAVHETDRQGLEDVLNLDAAGRSRSCEFRVQTPSGSTIYLYCAAYSEPCVLGGPTALYGTVQDVTTQRWFETEVAEIMRRDQMLLAAIDACPVSMSVADATQPDLPLIYVNRSFSQITGYEADEVIGRNPRFLQGRATDPEMVAEIRRGISAGKTVDVQVINYHKNGEQFLNRFVLAPVHNLSGQLTAYIGLQSDVTLDTQRKDIDTQRQKMEALGRMMGGVAHEINNLLQPITLLGQHILDNKLVTDQGREHLDVVLDCTVKARNVICDLLAFSKPTHRVLEVHDLVRLLDDSLRIVRRAIPPSVILSTAVQGLPPPIAIDRTVFVQIILNLVSNAVAAMEGRGEIMISVDDAPRSNQDQKEAMAPRWARLRVTDTGYGMNRATLERAFEPFFTTKPVGQGTGLGLPVVYGLIHEMGGTIALDSEPGRGTNVTILLPAKMET